MSAEVRLSWTQPICAVCFDVRQPGRHPARLKEAVREIETCVDCGTETCDGIYLRLDPKTARHPTRLK